ncbi:MAG TPA: HD domain-containing protein [bacterium]|nr:HD domain-containing protein [bacterium]
MSPTKKHAPSQQESVRALLKTHQAEDEHSEQVARLALVLFDQLKDLHRLGERWRNLLYLGALLHDIGLSESISRHHKHGCEIIANAPLDGFSEAEKWILANLARYHRKALPKASHECFSKLCAEDQEGVQKTAALLRVADGLDRSHRNAVSSIECQIQTGAVLASLEGRDLDDEVWAAEKKRDLFEEVYGMRLIFSRKESS